jgi:D-arabinitol dehydrogenase (NADP+)
VRAVVYEQPGCWQLRDLSEPQPGPRQVRLRVLCTGVCGTDAHLLAGGFLARFPLVPGHEIVGEVEAAGEGVTGLTPGTLVAADNTRVCGCCDECRRGRPLFCRNFCSLGVNAPGGFAELVVVDAEKCFPLFGLDPLVAVMTEPLACAVHGLDVLALAPVSDVLVLGAGPTGQLLAQLLHADGAVRVTVAAPPGLKLELAAALGADETVPMPRADPEAAVQALHRLAPSGFDVVVEATGSPAVLARCTSLTRTGGTLLVYGMAPEQATVAFSPYEIFQRELTIKGSFAQVSCFERAMALLRNRRVRTEGLVSRRVDLEHFADALAGLGDPACVKSVVQPAA